MFDNLHHRSWQALRHVAEILSPGVLSGAGAALGLRQDRKHILVIVPVWVLAAAITAVVHGTTLQAANCGRVAAVLSILTTLYTLQSSTQNEPLLDQIITCLRLYVMVTSGAAMVLAMGNPMPLGQNRSFEPFPVEKLNPLALEATPVTHGNRLDLMKASYATLDTVFSSTARSALSDVGSDAYDNMGPSSACPSCSSDGATELSLRSTGRVKSGLAQSVIRWSSIAIQTSQKDDVSTEAQPDTQ